MPLSLLSAAQLRNRSLVLEDPRGSRAFHINLRLLSRLGIGSELAPARCLLVGVPFFNPRVLPPDPPDHLLRLQEALEKARNALDLGMSQAEQLCHLPCKLPQTFLPLISLLVSGIAMLSV